jgi:hypothetical protein
MGAAWALVEQEESMMEQRELECKEDVGKGE